MSYSLTLLPHAEVTTLMRDAARGDQDAWRRLYCALEPWMKGVLRGRIPPYLRARFDERDVMQEAFLSLASTPRVLESADATSFAGYLAEILRNGLADQVRRHQRWRRNARLESRDAEHVLSSIECEHERPSDCAERSDLQAFVDDALSRVSNADREILSRRFLSQETWVEIARRTGVPEPTVRRRGGEALERLMRRAT